ncbi:hypothetical protein BDR04DRAFT_1147651 [Suillus decipiens]|nr:hypothetical protein BDR04DRAFT_1147651 [Suillus decipiens]
MQQVEHLPIPHNEYTDDVFDIVAENPSLKGCNFFDFSPAVAIPDERGHEFIITVAQIQADMRDVAFYFLTKTGHKLCDSGIADVILDGRGMAVTTHLVPADEDRSSIFQVEDVHVEVHSLKFRIHDSRFFVAPVVKSHVEKVVAQAIRADLEYLDGQLVTMKDRMEETKTKEKLNSPEVFHDVGVDRFSEFSR